MKDEVDNFLDGLNNEPKEDPFKPESEDPFASTKVEDEGDSKDDKAEEKLPYHKDPKVQKFIEREITKHLESIKPTESEKFTKEVNNASEEDSISEVLTRIIGNDTPEKVSAIKDFKKALGGMKEEAKQEALNEIKAREDEGRQAEIEAQEQIESAFEDIEEEFNVDLTSSSPTAKKLRSDFVDFIRRIAPKDKDGQVKDYPDFNEAFILFKDMKKEDPTTSRAKDLASRGMSRSGSGDTSSANKPIQDSSWKAVDKFFGKFIK